MPTNKKEGIYFGSMMCFGMVTVMTFYNLYLNGLLDDMAPLALIGNFVIGFIIALSLDLFVVGPVAKKVAFSLPFDKSKKVLVILAVSFCMVTGMVLTMSLYGVISAFLNGGLAGHSFISSYGYTIMMNFIVAFPLQLLVMGPLVRFLFIQFVQKKQVLETA